jgi:putative restriction endonuclease
MQVNQAERAARAWPLLVDVAKRHSTITYGDMAKILGIHHRTIRFVLSEIQDYCLAEKLPPITILVVDQKLGKPGAGFIAWDVQDLGHGLDLVYGYPWASIDNPFGFALDGETIESIAKAIIRCEISPAEAYQKVKVRGKAQQVFRAALLEAYGCRCALSEFRTEGLLEAAHIVPWQAASIEQRLDPCNGLLLSVMHHKLFDLGMITITADYRVRSNIDQAPEPSAERDILAKLDGKPLRLPNDEIFWPNAGYIKTRNELV